MKMRFWQKTYIFTLVLFLLCLNVGILSLTVYTYQRNVSSTEAAISAEQHFVKMSFERDFEDVNASDKSSSPALLMQSFGTYYIKKGVYLAFEENSQTVFSNFTDEYDIEKSSLRHIDLDGRRHILISSDVCDGRYQMIFAKNVESLDSEFRSLMITYALTAVGVSVILAVCLYFILKKLSEPLESLRHTTEAIEAGDFDTTAEETGNDEFTLLAKSFNSMLSEINRQMEVLENEARRKQMLVDNMAHELRTPLTSIHGYAEYIEKANITEENRLIATKYIISEADRLRKISELLLDGAFIRENEIEMTDTDLSEILYSVAESLRMKAGEAGVEIIYSMSPVTVHGNEVLLSMLFYNLTENAVKACTAGGFVKLSCSDGKAFVEDCGKGMTAEQLLHITEPFYRTDRSRSRAEGGAGLGLSLCRQIVQTHCAEMEFESEYGKGTRVTVTFTSLK